VVLVYAQIPIAATMKHVGAGLAIPDFPLAFGRLVPPLRLMASEQIAVHFLHRTWALVATVGLFLTAWRIWTRHAERQELTRPAALAPLLVLVQVSLGGLVVLSGRNLVIDTLHLATAALVLATSVVIALRAFRPLISTDAADLAARERRVVGSVPRASSASAMSAPGMNPARRGGR
jgi:heme A synthase